MPIESGTVIRDVSINLRDLNILYINLDRRPERRQNIEHELSRLGLCGTRIRAVDGSTMSDEQVDYWMQKTNFNTMSRNPDKVMGKVGCMLSHLKALKYAIDNNFDNVLILEDDAKFIIKDSDLVIKIPKDADMFYLGGLYWWKTSEFPMTSDEINDLVDHFHKNGGEPPDLTFENIRDDNYYYDKIQILPNYFRIACTFGYVINTHGTIRHIYNTILNSKKKAIDMMYVTYVQRDLNTFIVNPSLLVQSDSFASDVTDIGKTTPSNPFNNSYFYDRNIYTIPRAIEFYKYNYRDLLKSLRHIYRKNKIIVNPRKLFKHLRLLYKDNIYDPANK
jgi:GR25 family glycosyltransferase involved in LPS biosynthesis